MVLKLFCFTCTIKKIVEYETLFGSGINSNMNPNFFFFFYKKKKTCNYGCYGCLEFLSSVNFMAKKNKEKI